MENKTCLKPPTSTSNLPIPAKWLIWLMLHPLMANQQNSGPKKNEENLSSLYLLRLIYHQWIARKTISGWWYAYPSEKCESVSWDDFSFPTEWQVIIHSCSLNHQPDYEFGVPFTISPIHIKHPNCMVPMECGIFPTSTMVYHQWIARKISYLHTLHRICRFEG